VRCQPIVSILHIYIYILTHTREHAYPVQATHMSNHTCTWIMICIHTHQRCIHITPLFDIYVYAHTHTHTHTPYRQAIHVLNDSVQAGNTRVKCFIQYVHDIYTRTSEMYLFDLPVCHTQSIQFVTQHIQFVTQHIQFITQHIQFVTPHIQFVTQHIQFVTHHIQFVTQHIQLVTQHIQFVTHAASKRIYDVC